MGRGQGRPPAPAAAAAAAAAAAVVAPWSVNDVGADKHVLTPAAEAKYKEWKQIVNSNVSPWDAANALGDSNYEKLRGLNPPHFSFRIGKKDRVMLTLSGHQVNVLKIGSHKYHQLG